MRPLPCPSVRWWTAPVAAAPSQPAGRMRLRAGLCWPTAEVVRAMQGCALASRPTLGTPRPSHSIPHLYTSIAPPSAVFLSPSADHSLRTSSSTPVSASAQVSSPRSSSSAVRPAAIWSLELTTGRGWPVALSTGFGAGVAYSNVSLKLNRASRSWARRQTQQPPLPLHSPSYPYPSLPFAASPPRRPLLPLLPSLFPPTLPARRARSHQCNYSLNPYVLPGTKVLPKA